MSDQDEPIPHAATMAAVGCVGKSMTQSPTAAELQFAMDRKNSSVAVKAERNRPSSRPARHSETPRVFSAEIISSPEAGKEDLPGDNPDFADDPLFLFGTDHQGMFGLEFLYEGIQGM
jgi:hypothetical protein